MIYSAHQPNYFPYLGLFYKIYKSDKFVFLDDVQFTKSSGPAHERNKISIGTDIYYIKVPIKYHFKDKINEVKINYSREWAEEHLSKLSFCYKESPFYETVIEDIRMLLSLKYDNLAELNIALIMMICKKANIRCEFYRSSLFNIKSSKTNRLIELGRALRCDEYYSGTGAKAYMDCDAMKENGISVTFSDYKTAEYYKDNQLCNSNMSVLDYLFYYGYDFSSLGWDECR
ncbi:MAG: WbqC family protein [Eubacterium sp.]